MAPRTLDSRTADLAVAVAAIRALTNVIQRSEAQTMMGLEKDLLQALATAEGNLLENASLIESLSRTKEKAAEIEEALQQSAAQTEARARPAHHRSRTALAQRGSLHRRRGCHALFRPLCSVECVGGACVSDATCVAWQCSHRP